MFPIDKYWKLLRVNWNFCLRNTFVYEDLIQIWIYTIMLFSSFVFYITLIFHFSLFVLARGTLEEFWQLTISHMTCDGSLCLNLLYSMFWPWKSPATTHFFPEIWELAWTVAGWTVIVRWSNVLRLLKGWSNNVTCMEMEQERKLVRSACNS